MACLEAPSLLCSGRYEEAVNAATASLRRCESGTDYVDRAIAHLNLNQLDRARLDFEAADRCQGGSAPWLALVDWLSGDERRAADAWHRLAIAAPTRDVSRADLTAGILHGARLFFAAVHLADDTLFYAAHRLLYRLTKARWVNAWPGPIAHLLLDHLRPADLLGRVSSAPHVGERQSCQAHFYSAVRARRLRDAAGSAQHLTAAAEAPPAANIEIEYYLARHELARH
jgi:hypothetical protein